MVLAIAESDPYRPKAAAREAAEADAVTVMPDAPAAPRETRTAQTHPRPPTATLQPMTPAGPPVPELALSASAADLPDLGAAETAGVLPLDSSAASLRPAAGPSPVVTAASVPWPPIQAQLVAEIRHNEGTVELHLSPEELGKVQIDIRRDGDALTIGLTAERQDTLDLLRRNSDQLINDLRSSGQVSVNLSFGRWAGKEPPPPPDPTSAPTAIPEDQSQQNRPGLSGSYLPGQGLYLRI